jgi:hypothetical protein
VLPVWLEQVNMELRRCAQLHLENTYAYIPDFQFLLPRNELYVTTCELAGDALVTTQ